MYGALLGDMIGAPYEFDRGTRARSFRSFARIPVSRMIPS